LNFVDNTAVVHCCIALPVDGQNFGGKASEAATSWLVGKNVKQMDTGT